MKLSHFSYRVEGDISQGLVFLYQISFIEDSRIVLLTICTNKRRITVPRRFGDLTGGAKGEMVK